MKSIILHLSLIVFLTIVIAGDILILKEVIAPMPELPAWAGLAIMVAFMVFAVFSVFPVLYTYSHICEEIEK